MTDQPHALDLDAIEARTNAATPGPWFNDSHEIYAGENTDIPAMSEWIGETCDPRRPDHGAANAAFIAAARTDVPALVAEIRRLTAERDRYRDAWRNARTRARDSDADESMWRRIVTRTEQDRDNVLADNDRLTAELQQAQQQDAAIRCWSANTTHGSAAAEISQIINPAAPSGA